MIMVPVKSSNIKAAGFNTLAGTMRIQFSNGTEYDYEGVNAEMYNNFLESKSQGRFFHQNIKGKLTGTKVKKEEDNG